VDRVRELIGPGWGAIGTDPGRHALCRALRGALGCWPKGAAERTVLADALGVSPPVPRAGETLLVSVSLEARRVALWQTTDVGGERDSVPLVGTAEATARSTLHLTMRDHPMPAPARLHQALRAAPKVRARRVLKRGVGMDRRLDGTSFGLALGLASASWLANVPLPANVVALATLDGAGRTGPVDALAEKIGAVIDFAAGVDTVLVAGSQVQQARDLLDEQRGGSGAGVAVYGCPSLGEALQRFLPLDPSALRTMGPAHARAAVRRLFSVAVMGTPHALSWGGVADALAGLLDGPAGRLDDEGVRRGTFGRAVALRHAGRQVGPAQCDEDWVRGLPRPVRLKVAAHLVQDASDGAFPLLAERIRIGGALLGEPLERHDDDLRLLGALGRAEAAMHAWASATDLLDEAVTGWEGLDLLPQASYPLCELLRVLGIQGDAVAVGALFDGLAGRLLSDPRTVPLSAAFVLQAMGRAAVQVGDYGRALSLLSEGAAAWELQPRHLRSAQLRWLARAEEATGGKADARATRDAAESVTRGVGGHEEFGLLVALDAALAEGADGSEVVAQLAAGGRSAAEIRRLRELGCVEAAEMAEVWRY